jgi:hypothetical protein
MKTTLYAAVLVALAAALGGCVINPVKIEHATVTIHADKVAAAQPSK